MELTETSYRTPMFEIDRQSPEVRAVVHEYGWAFVKEMLRAGITSHRQMRHIAYAVYSNRGAGTVIREVPNDAEIEAIGLRLANVYGRGSRPNRDDKEAARQIAGFMWKQFHWGRCLCTK